MKSDELMFQKGDTVYVGYKDRVRVGTIVSFSFVGPLCGEPYWHVLFDEGDDYVPESTINFNQISNEVY